MTKAFAFLCHQCLVIGVDGFSEFDFSLAYDRTETVWAVSWLLTLSELTLKLWLITKYWLRNHWAWLGIPILRHSVSVNTLCLSIGSGNQTLRPQDTSAPRHFGTGAELSHRHFGTGYRNSKKWWFICCSVLISLKNAFYNQKCSKKCSVWPIECEELQMLFKFLRAAVSASCWALLSCSDCFITGRICLKGSSAGISFTNGPILGFFAPQGRHVAPIKVKFVRDEWTLRPAKFDLDRFRGGGLRPPKLKKIELYQYNCP